MGVESAAPPFYSCESLSLNLVVLFSLSAKSDEEWLSSQMKRVTTDGLFAIANTALNALKCLF